MTTSDYDFIRGKYACAYQQEHDRLILIRQQTWQSRIETECYSVTYIIMFEMLYN